MALLKYFKKATVLPNPEGPLSDPIPPAAISSTNKEVEDLVMRELINYQENEDSISAIPILARVAVPYVSGTDVICRENRKINFLQLTSY